MMLRASALRAHTHTGATGLTVTLAQAEASRRYAAQRPAGIHKADCTAQRRVESPAATSDLELDAWDLGPVTILCSCPCNRPVGFPIISTPGGCIASRPAPTNARPHRGSTLPRNLTDMSAAKQGHLGGPATCTRPRGRTCPSGFLHCTLERSPDCDPCAKLTGGSRTCRDAGR